MMRRGHRTSPPKYQRLSEYLAALSADEVRLTVPAIEAIVGFPLPAGAQEGWFWSNHPAGTLRVRPWVQVGWRVATLHRTLDIDAVTFARVAPDAPP
jgi:hypothetical protein